MSAIPEGLIRNQPSPEGEALGGHLAGYVEAELAKLKVKYPNHREPCGTCAFRRGSVPNRCASTLMDALKAVMEKTEFHCHETGERCCGWFILHSTSTIDRPSKLPWDWSLSDKSKDLIEGMKR